MPDRLLAVFPAYRDNPYLNLMLLAPRARGWNVLESLRLEQLEQHLGRFGTGDVFHMHWTSPIVQRHDDDLDEAQARLDRFRTAVDAARTRGARLVWTIHNVLPHDARHLELELELNRYLAGAADVVHVMNRDTPTAVSSYYELDPAKVVHLPHPSYQGVYPDSVSREEARASLGLTDRDHAVLAFGQMRPYKGIDVLVEAVRRTEPSERPVLLLAGRTTSDDLEEIDRSLGDDVRAVREHDQVEDIDVQRWFRAADTAVFPYRRVLNSGVLHLAASFGVPSVLPDEPHLRAEFGDEGWIRWFDAGDAVESLRVVLAGPAAGAAVAAEFSRRLAPFASSRRYAELLDAVRG
ncbi:MULTISPECIES: glycosyltransferase [unclassified Curtobacterium]|uniref:glycosyltransferase n=1 Tax=unclassified Curtobacterium TaxID=257496 RepID=UPI0010434970|nr:MULTISPECIES: glycosyltransferase [unclassified Curtobacterium]TCL81324.1 glycosyltransferase involved in cell wall biosynthesis [Curtobacterium sp. PhB128]TCL99449.1 glycosyltransferase involved in cell wall biosynthesis [Curtobacterium sp. PhB138]